MRTLPVRRASRPKRSLSPLAQVTSQRSLLCVDLRAIENHFQQKPVEELRHQSRGSRLGALLSTLDLDPRYPLQKNLQRLPLGQACAVFDALCEELADSVLFDMPKVAWQPLVELLAPQGFAESPYPKELSADSADETSEGLLLLVEGRFAAEAAHSALQPAFLPKGASRPDGLGESQETRVGPDAPLWMDVRQTVLSMLESVREKGRALLMEK